MRPLVIVRPAGNATAAHSRRSVGVGVLGLGRIGVIHARNLVAGVPGARLVAVADAAPARAVQVGVECGVVAVDSVDELLGIAGVDAVVIATPVDVHAEGVARAAAAGRHVLCEKPLARTAREAEDLVSAVERTGVALQVGFHMRFDPDVAAVAARVHAGALGDIVTLRGTLRDMQPPYAGYLARSGGLLLDGASHLLDLGRWLGGEITEVTTVAAVRNAAIAAHGDHDVTVVVARFESGAVGVFENGRSSGYGFDCSLEVVGTDGSARVSEHRRRHVAWLSPGIVSADHVVDFVERFHEAYREELRAFASALREGRRVEPSGDDAVATTRLVETAERALEAGVTVSTHAPNARRPRNRSR